MGRGRCWNQMRKGFKRDVWRIVRGDRVMITAGKDRGKVSTVTKVFRNIMRPRVLLEGLNLARKHVKKQGNTAGGIISIEQPVHYSNVQLVDPVTNKPVRSQYRFLEDGTKVRIGVGKNASGSVIPKSDILKQRKKPLLATVGPKGTPMAEAYKVTYVPPSKESSPMTGFAASGVTDSK